MKTDQDSRSQQVHIETFGCQMNQYDSELVRSLLKARGFTLTEDKERADVILMNTCAIREHAHNRVYGHLAELKAIKRQRNLVVGVLGCMAQNLKTELIETEPIVDILVGPDSYRRLPDLISKALESQGQDNTQPGIAVDLYHALPSRAIDRTPMGLRFPCHWNREGAASGPGASRRAERRPQSGSRISPSLAAISSGLQRPSALLTPVCVTTFISAMRPPPT